MKTRLGLLGAFLTVAILLAYANIYDNSPTNWDDPSIFSNSVYREFTSANLYKIWIPQTLRNYQPVRDTSYLLDFRLWGPDQTNIVRGMHGHSLLLYILMIWACWLFLLELFRQFEVEEAKATWWAFAATALFALHPVHVESVTWLYARKEPLMGLFVFLSLWCFLKSAANRWLLVPTALFFGLGALSKSTALVLPIIMLSIDIAQGGNQTIRNRRTILYACLLIISVGASGALVKMMQQAGGVMNWHGGNPFTNMLAVSQIYVEYMLLIGATVNYAADYIFPLYLSLSQPRTWAFIAVNLGIITSAFWGLRRNHRLLFVFVVWYYVFLLPTVHLIPISQLMTDRYALLPSLSWCILLSWALTSLSQSRSRIISNEFCKLLAVGLFLFVFTFYGFMTHRQNDIWQNSLTLWEDTIVKAPDSIGANINLAQIYNQIGKSREAERLCLRVVQSRPFDYFASNNLALAQMLQGKYPQATDNYIKTLRLKPSLVQAQLGLAETLWRSGNWPALIAFYQQMEDVNADTSTMRLYRMAYAYMRLGDSKNACELLKNAPKTINDKSLSKNLNQLRSTACQITH